MSSAAPSPSARTAAAPAKKKRRWKRGLLLWLLGIALGLLLLALAAWWQRLWIARSLWSQAVEQLAAEKVYLGGEVSSVEWDKGLILENLTFYEDEAHALPLFALEKLQLRPERNPHWGVQLSVKDSEAMLYSSLRQEQISPLTLELHFSPKQVKLERLQGLLGVMDLDLQDIVYKFSTAKDAQVAKTEREAEAEKKSDSGEEQGLTAEGIEEFLSWIDWELAKGGEFSLQIKRLLASQEGIQDLDANINIAKASLPRHELQCDELSLSTLEASAEEVELSLIAKGLSWSKVRTEGTTEGSLTLQPNPDPEVSVSKQAALGIPKLIYQSSRRDLEFEGIELQYADLAQGQSFALSTEGGSIGAEAILPLQAQLTRQEQLTEIEFGKLESSAAASEPTASTAETASPAATALEGSLRWDGAQKLLQVPELTLDLNLWKIAASLREREAILGELESRSVPRVVIRSARGDFSGEEPVLTGTVSFTRAAEFYSPQYDFAFGLETGNYHLQQSALLLENLRGNFLGAPIAAQGKLSWANPEQPLLLLQTAQLAPDLEPLARLAKLEEEQRIKLRGKPQITLSNVSLPLQKLRELQVGGFQINGKIELERTNEQGRVLSACVEQMSGSCQPGLLQLNQFQAKIMDAKLFAGATDLEFLGEDKHLQVEALEFPQLDLAQLSKYLNSQERWNLQLEGKLEDFLVSEFSLPLEENARPDIQAFALTSNKAQVTLLRSTEEGESLSLPLGLRLIQGRLSPTNLSLETAQLAIEDGSLKLSGLQMPLPTESEAEKEAEIPPAPESIKLLRLAELKAQDLPAQPIGEFAQLGRFGIELGGTTNLQVENLFLPLDSPSQLSTESFRETGKLAIAYTRPQPEGESQQSERAEALNFLIEQTQGRYTSQGIDFSGLQGEALGGKIELGETKLRWTGQARGVVAQRLEIRPDLSQLEPLLQLEEKRLRLGGTPLLQLEQVQLNFQDPASFDVQNLLIQDPILVGIRTGEEQWLELQVDRLEGLYNPGEFTATSLQAQLFDGTLVLDGSKVSWAEGLRWSVPDLSLESMNLGELAVWAGMEKDGSLQGFLEAFGQLQGTADVAELQGELALDAREGRFYSLPVLGPLHLLLKQLVPQLPEDVAKVAQVTLNFGEGKISTDDLLIESTATQINLAGEFELATSQVKADAAINFRGLVGVATFLLSEALKVRGQGPVDDVRYSFTYLPLPGVGNFDQFEQLPDNFLSLPGVSEIPGLKEIPGIGEALEAVDGVRNIPLIRDIPLLGRKKDDQKEEEAQEVIEGEALEVVE